VGKIFHYDVPGDIGGNGLDDPVSWERVINPRGRDVTDQQLIFNAEPARPISAALSWLAAEGRDEEQTDGMVTSSAITLLHEVKDRRFFLGVGFFRPHTPFVAPKRYFDRYPLASLTLPASPVDDRSDIPPAAFAHNCRIPHYGLERDTCLLALQAYLASVSFVDAQIGRLLDALDALALTQQTVVVVWSDHGYHLGEHQGMWQKRTLFEPSIRTPLIIAAPGLAGGQHCERVVELLDVYPTICDLVGIAPPAEVAGRSLLPLLRQPDATWDHPAFAQIVRPLDGRMVMGRSIITKRFKYTEWDEGRAGREFYDLATDPQEFVNRAMDPALIETMQGLRLRLVENILGTVPDAVVDPRRL
jgi:uncharacterized sulfatase